MPPIAITFHSTLPLTLTDAKLPKAYNLPRSTQTSHSYPLINTGKPSPLYFTYTPKITSTTPAQKPVPAPALVSNNGESSTSPRPVTPTVPDIPNGITQRRKSFLSTPHGQVASLTPHLQPIVARCLPARDSNTTSPSSGITPLPSPPRKGFQGAKKATPKSSWPIHPYSRLSDTTNDRSTNPSPKEILRAEKAELAKVKVREESAALARGAAVAKRRRGRAKAGTKSQARSASPRDKLAELEAVPTITTEPASSSNSPTSTVPTLAPAPSTAMPPAPRVGLKRTRSIGLGISTANANANGSQMAVGSPLRSVTGPNSPEQEGGRDPKRSRLNDHSDARVTRRASSGSPVIPLQSLPSVNLGAGAGAGSAATARRSSGAGLTTEATAMRRAVSATGFIQPGSSAMSRTGSTGMGGSSPLMGDAAVVAGRERARREVTLPGRLRDYETRVGTAT